LEALKKINTCCLKRGDTNRDKGGRPRHADRRYVEAMLWILRTGAPWRDLPSCFPSWSSVYARFRRWTLSGLWKQILAELSKQADTEYVMADGTVVRAHQHASCKRRDQDNQALGRSRGGLSTKLHWLCDSLGYPLGLIATAGQKAECVQALGLLNQHREAFDYFLADTGYDSDAIREGVKQRGGIAVIKPNPSRSQKPLYDKHLYKERHRVENLIAKLKHSRRIATRYDKKAAHFIAFAQLAAIKIWLCS
tara:strand:+ start:90 stop:842 length:753 start_codon:yes stop_codon:yes gene_type:complete